MATRYDPAALEVALGVIPSLPRPLLSRLVQRAIDHLDQLDGDCDLEEDDYGEEDHVCSPHVASGEALQ
jgi:hypothetical protein